MKHIDIQSLGAEIKVYKELDAPVYRYINPSVAWHDNKLKISLRASNFAVVPKGKWYFRDGSAYSRTHVVIGDLNPDKLTISKLAVVPLSSNAPTRTLVAGLEDVRLFSRKDGLHAIGFESDRLTVNLHNESASLAEYVVKGRELKYLRTLDKPDKKVVEKNWCPPEKATRLFDFTYSDTQVWKGGKLIGKPTKTNIHGGSQLINKSGGGYFSIVHEKKRDPAVIRNQHMGGNIYDANIYYTYLAEHDERGIITRLSKPFRFGSGHNIEFASGLVEYNGDFIITYGIGDFTFGIARIKAEKLLTLFED